MRDSLKLVPSGVHLSFLLFLHVVQPVLLVQEQLTAVAAFDRVNPVCLSGMMYKLIVTAKFCVAFVALGLLPVEEVHERIWQMLAIKLDHNNKSKKKGLGDF